MKENIEEDITRIENILNNEKNFKKNRRGNKEIRFEVNSLMYNTLKFLISDYKRVLKENEELKEKWDKDTHKLQNDLDIANAKKNELEQKLMGNEITPMEIKLKYNSYKTY